MKTLDEARLFLQQDDNVRDHFESELVDFQVKTPDTVMLDTQEYALSPLAEKQLCKILDIPQRFSETLNNDDDNLWKVMTTRLKDLRSTQIRYSVNEKNRIIHSVNPVETPWIGNAEFIDIVQRVIEKQDNNITLKGIGFGKNDSLTAQFISNHEEASIVQSGMPDLFKIGFDVCNAESLAISTGISYAIERLVCTNRATVTDKEYKRTLVHKGSQQLLVNTFYSEFYKMLTQNISVEKFIREKLGSFLNVNASLSEMADAYAIGERCIDNLDVRVVEFDTLIPLKNIEKRYGIESVYDKSQTWRRTASTPMNLYELYNNVTHIASNAKDLSEEEKVKMQIQIGRSFIGHTPDLLDIAPVMTWN